MAHSRVAVVEWSAWDRFLMPHIVDGATRIEVNPFEAAGRGAIVDLALAFDLVCFQINISVSYDLPLDLAGIASDLENKGVRLVNARCRDITKATLHRTLFGCGLPSLQLTAAPAVPCKVIVKSNLNYGGTVERRHATRLPKESIVARLLRGGMGPFSYRVECSTEVPASAFADDGLVVERYVENVEECIYRTYFAGDHRVVVKVHGTGPIKKVNGDNRDTNTAYSEDETAAAVELLPTEVVEIGSKLPRAMAVEFGCIDIVIDDDGHAFAVDINPTPSAGDAPPPREVLEYLRRGLQGTTKASCVSEGAAL